MTVRHRTNLFCREGTNILIELRAELRFCGPQEIDVAPVAFADPDNGLLAWFSGQARGAEDTDVHRHDQTCCTSIPESSHRFSGAGSGERQIFVNSRWLLRLSGMVQLPLGFNLSAVFSAREGYVKPTYVTVTIPGIGSTKLFGNPDGGGGKYGDYRLPSMYVVNMRIEKTFPVMERASVAIAVDAFNLLNSAHAMKQDSVIGSPTFNQDQRILDPRVIRVGIRFSF